MDKRIFVSIDLPSEIKDYLTGLQNKGIYWIKWSKPENLHITLNFLGDLEEQAIRDALSCSAEVASQNNAFRLALKNFQFEKDMLWVILEHSDDLEKIQEELKDAFRTRRIGKRERRSYVPHVLLGRSKTGRPVARLQRDWGVQGFRPKEFLVEGINVYESRLTPGAATHVLIQSFALNEQKHEN